MKKIKRILTLVLSLVVVVSSFVPSTVAFAGVVKYPALSPEDTLTKSVTPWYKWNQSQEPWADERSGNGAYSLQEAGCWVVSSAILMAMAGIDKLADGSNITPATVNSYMMKNGGFLGENFVHTAPNQVSGGRFTLIEAVFNDSFSNVKSRVSSGQYAMIFSGAHMVAVYRIQGDKILILDPESAQFNNGQPRMQYIDSSYNMRAENDNSLLYQHPFATVLYFKGEKPSTESRTVESAWSQSDGGTTKTIEDANKGAEEVKGGSWKFDEGYIPNMPKDRDYSKIGRGTEDWNNFLKKSQEKASEDFKEGSEDSIAIAKWKEERDFNLGKESVSFVRRGFMFVGIFIAFITSLFLVIYMFDRWNPVGISLLSLVTKDKVVVLGSNKFLDKSEYNVKSQVILTDLNIFIAVCILSLLSVLIINGTLYIFLTYLLDISKNILSNFNRN